MINITQFNQLVLSRMANRLKEARLARNESQEVFAARIGISRQSYAKMENGSATTAIGYWLIASELLDKLDTWDSVLSSGEDLFEEFERQQNKRQRASRQVRSDHA